MGIFSKRNQRLKQTPEHVYTIGMGAFFVGLSLLVDTLINTLGNNILFKIAMGAGIFAYGLYMVAKSQEQESDNN